MLKVEVLNEPKLILALSLTVATEPILADDATPSFTPARAMSLTVTVVVVLVFLLARVTVIVGMAMLLALNLAKSAACAMKLPVRESWIAASSIVESGAVTIDGMEIVVVISAGL